MSIAPAGSLALINVCNSRLKSGDKPNIEPYLRAHAHSSKCDHFTSRQINLTLVFYTIVFYVITIDASTLLLSHTSVNMLNTVLILQKLRLQPQFVKMALLHSPTNTFMARPDIGPSTIRHPRRTYQSNLRKSIDSPSLTEPNRTSQSNPFLNPRKAGHPPTHKAYWRGHAKLRRVLKRMFSLYFSQKLQHSPKRPHIDTTSRNQLPNRLNGPLN